MYAYLISYSSSSTGQQVEEFCFIDGDYDNKQSIHYSNGGLITKPH
jgi:hypothetical protein